jgi:hypothetical protein
VRSAKKSLGGRKKARVGGRRFRSRW